MSKPSVRIELDNLGYINRCFIFTLCVVAVFGIIGTFHSVVGHASADISEIKSGVNGYCLDDHNSKVTPGTPIDAWGCNDTAAQSWKLTTDNITHNDNLCLSVDDNGQSAGDKIVLGSCNDSSGQVWLRDKTGLYNPNSKDCLSLPNNQPAEQLIIASCSGLSGASETWQATDPPVSCQTLPDRGDKVACYAEQEWETWQTGTPSHNTLLNAYTDGAPYEEWCADFVSYVYKEAGYPFINGEADGWDESNANYIQYQGFTQHDPSNYDPQPGDVAYFDYEGGHVEIVISGGKHPTFIYGNSATIDPTTGNGEMESNTITKDGSLGGLVYYLSPN